MSDERYYVLGTAGHIDHGKTSLVKALTGVDTDRFIEEKQRGITIDIGFARYSTPGGVTFGIVDVPGHAKFIRNMVAGAIGIDLVMLVVAADDGVMPQTIEHLHIAGFLGVQTGLIALTKCDVVDEDTLELAAAEVKELVEPTFLAGCPVIPVSSVTKTGLDELAKALEKQAEKVGTVRSGDRFRMPVDRSFSIKGAGTVVTGTVIAGNVKVDDELQVMPSGKKGRVRSIQIHGENVNETGPGHRTAINLAGVDKDEIQRGDVVVEPDSISATYMFDAEVELLPGTYSPLHSGSEAQMHIGTAELTAKVHPLDAEHLLPGTTAMVQFRLAQELPLAVGDRFILRSSSSLMTIGGGKVLDAHPTKHKRRRATASEKLSVLTGIESWRTLVHEIEKAPFGIDRHKLPRLLNLSEAALGSAIEGAKREAGGLVEHIGGQQVTLTMPVNRERVVKALVDAIGVYHKAHPLVARGLGLKELSKSLGSGNICAAPALAKFCSAAAVEQGLLVEQGESFALPGHEVKLSARDTKAVELISKRLNHSVTAEQPEEFISELNVDKARLRDLVDHLIEAGEIVRSPGKLLFGSEIVKETYASLQAHLADGGGVTVGDFSKLTGSSRKYSIPLLQLLEQDGMLIRDGDLRKLNPAWDGASGGAKQ